MSLTNFCLRCGSEDIVDWCDECAPATVAALRAAQRLVDVMDKQGLLGSIPKPVLDALIVLAHALNKLKPEGAEGIDVEVEPHAEP